MNLSHTRTVFLTLVTTAALSLSCGSDDPGTTAGIDPLTGQPGTPGGSAAGVGGTAGGPGGTASGTAGGTTGGTGHTSGTAGGVQAGGAISSVIVEQMPCEKKVRQAGKTIPDFMIVLDRSGSMQPQAGIDCSKTDLGSLITCGILGIDCNDPALKGTTQCGGTSAAADRWTPAVAAVKSLTKMFEAKVNFGLTTFPGDGGGGRNDNGCATGAQRVPVGLMSAAAIATALDATKPEGNTPTGPTLDAVLKQIQSKKTSPDDVVPPQYVLLVTDGQPTCPMGGNGGNNPAAHQATIAAIDALSKAGVKTFVIGYDASVNAQLAKQLTEYAQHGGTNNFYAVQDGPSLVSQFTSITSVVAECSYQLDKKPDDPKYVLVELDGQKLNLDTPDGWIIDGSNVTIQGNACTTLRDGNRMHTLAVTVECAPIPLN
jgi:Mg-chelatase subunit ChlD